MGGTDNGDKSKNIKWHQMWIACDRNMKAAHLHFKHQLARSETSHNASQTTIYFLLSQKSTQNARWRPQHAALLVTSDSAPMCTARQSTAKCSERALAAEWWELGRAQTMVSGDLVGCHGNRWANSDVPGGQPTAAPDNACKQLRHGKF